MPNQPPEHRTEGLEFKQASPGSEASIETLLRAAFDPYVALLGRRLNMDAYRWLPNSITQGNVWIAVRDDEIVGVVALSPEEHTWLIDEMAVPPQMQGFGIGSWMLERVEQRARAQGIKSLTLCTARMMSDLLRLYRRLGYVIIMEGPPKHGKDEHPRVYMEKMLE